MIGFVINPVSGNGRGQHTWTAIQNILKQRNLPYAYRLTKRSKDAVQMAYELAALPEVTTIVAVGGDGTVHETANGLYRAGCNKPLGYIPAGSGNDFARAFHIPNNAEQALEMMLNPPSIRNIDLFSVQDRVAVDSLGAGFDGTIARITNDAVYKRWLNRLKLGKLAYVWSLLRVIAGYSPGRVRLTIDGSAFTFDRVWLITAANIPYFGGGMMICPDADPADGLATICVVSGISRWQLLRVFPRVYKGTHMTHPAVHFFQGKHLYIAPEQKLDMHMDGEAAGTAPATIEVLPSAMSIIAAKT